jgi:hypothetical protein
MHVLAAQRPSSQTSLLAQSSFRLQVPVDVGTQVLPLHRIAPQSSTNAQRWPSGQGRVSVQALPSPGTQTPSLQC